VGSRRTLHRISIQSALFPKDFARCAGIPSIPHYEEEEMKLTTLGKQLLIASGLAAMLVTVTLYASFNEPIGSGVMAYSALVDGPATVSMRRLTIFPGEVLGWHAHPGAGAYTIVTQGTLTVEDGCGTETVYTSGQAFLEPPNRVHRGKNLGTTDVITAQMFIVPQGSPASISYPGPLCGPPTKISDCKNDGWAMFSNPRVFENQGACEQYVITGR
jgi:quercetin dioxygenase-like cupin family protein